MNLSKFIRKYQIISVLLGELIMALLLCSPDAANRLNHINLGNFAGFISPVSFELDTRKMVDGKHILKIVSKDPTGKEGLHIIPFEVRNGPSIAIEGIKENAVVDGVLPLMINAYSKGDQKTFLIAGSQAPQTIPSWVWILIIGFAGWVLYYLITYLSIKDN